MITHWKPIAALATPFGALAGAIIAGYLTLRSWAVTYNNTLLLEKTKADNAVNLEKKKAELAFVSDQIQHLYGPLVSLSQTRLAAFNAMMHGRLRGGFFDGSKLDPNELRQWRLWRTEVLAPLVEQMGDAILKNAHLIEGTKIPDSFLKLMAHMASYKAVIKNWEYVIALDKERGTQTIDEQSQDEHGDFWPTVPHSGVDNFPKDFYAEVERSFKTLKFKQTDLINSTQQ
jgi:hypothetical protein